MQINVTQRMRAQQLAARTIKAIDGDDVIWLSRASGRRNALATMDSAAALIGDHRPDVRRIIQMSEGTSTTMVWSANPAEFTGIGYFNTSRPERFRLTEVNGDLVAVPVEDDPAA